MKTRSNEQKTVLVIGAGIGGIATAARLAQHGYQVTVVEKADKAGGRCNLLVKDGHYFDTGPTFFLMNELYEQTFADLGENMADHLDLRRVDPTYRLHFGDGSQLALTSDLNAMQTQLEAIESGSFGSFLRYLDEGRLHYKLSLKHAVDRHFRSIWDYFSPKNVPLLFKLKALRRHYANVGRYFSDPRLRAAFTFQDMYLSLSPYEAPATFSLLQYTELADGIWFPIGGMYRVIEVLRDIAEKLGVKFIYNVEVKEITIENKRASGVTLTDGQHIAADIVVANADLPHVYLNLLPDEGPARQMKRKKYTCSAVAFFWGVDKAYPQLGTHNLFLTGDYHTSIDGILKDLDLPDDPILYVHAPTRVDPSRAPEGQDTLTVVVPVGHINEDDPQDWATITERARRIVFERLAEIGADDLEQHIKFEESWAPPDWQSMFNLVKGSTHGLDHSFTQMGYLRPRNRHSRYHNLYFAGASTHPGSGLPTVLVSAKLTTERILEEIPAQQSSSVQSRPQANTPAFAYVEVQ
jgi:phytoene desaturase